MAASAGSDPGPHRATPSEDLLREWQETGDPEVLDRLLRREVDILKRMIQGRGHGLLRGTFQATDLAQEAVLGLLKQREPPTFDNPAALRGYLWKSAWRLLTGHLRKRAGQPARVDPTTSRRLEDLAATTGGMGEPPDADRTVALELALNLLRPGDREILQAAYLQEMSLAEVARKLGLSKEAANMRLVRARRRLAEKLAGWDRLIR